VTDAAEIDVRQAIEDAPVGRYHVFLASLIALIVTFEGYGNFNAAYVIPYVMGPWHLKAGQAGLLVSSGMIGFAAGSLTQGKFSDRFGRRVMILCALWMASLFSLATATATSFWAFCVWRALTGIGLGILLPLGVTYMNEFSPKRLKHTFSTWGWGLGFSAGGVAAAVVGIYLTPAFGWQSLYYVASLSAIVAVICHFALPESLQFRAMRGETQETGAVLSRLDPANAGRYCSPQARFTFPERSDQSASVRLLLSPRYCRTTISVWGAAFFILFAVYGLTGWVPTAMMQRGETFSASFAFGATILGMNFFGTLACGYLADRWRNGRAALVVWWTGGALAVGALAVANGHWLNLLSMGFAGLFVLGGQGTLCNLTASWYETEVRGTAVGMMLGVGRIGGVLGPYLVGLLQQVLPGSTGLFLAISIAIVLGAVCIGFARQETKANPPVAVVG
jgi:AAHS family 4-hydroxybenzoate transporter-like MFS transporter